MLTFGKEVLYTVDCSYGNKHVLFTFLTQDEKKTKCDRISILIHLHF